MNRPARRAVVAIALLLGVASCAEHRRSAEAEAALALFREASLPDDARSLDVLLEVPDDERGRAALLEALDAIAGLGAIETVRVQPLPEAGGTVVDLTASIEGGGSADFSVRLAPDGDRWRILSFAGPGVEWPTPRRRRGDGLSTRSPTGSDDP